MAVDQIKKPAGQWCKHCSPGKGCKIYDARPQECRTFDCGWLLSDLPERFRPDRCHVIISVHDEIRLHGDRYAPDALNVGAGKELYDALSERFT
jgi:uncharacterized protein